MMMVVVMFAGFGSVLPVLLDSRVITTDSEGGEGKKEKKERKQAALHSISRQQREKKRKKIFFEALQQLDK